MEKRTQPGLIADVYNFVVTLIGQIISLLIKLINTITGYFNMPKINLSELTIITGILSIIGLIWMGYDNKWFKFIWCRKWFWQKSKKVTTQENTITNYKIKWINKGDTFRITKPNNKQKIIKPNEIFNATLEEIPEKNRLNVWPFPLAIKFDKNCFDEVVNEIDNAHGIQKYKFRLYCEIYNSNLKDTIDDITVVLHI